MPVCGSDEGPGGVMYFTVGSTNAAAAAAATAGAWFQEVQKCVGDCLLLVQSVARLQTE